MIDIYCGSKWRPQLIKRVIGKLETSTLPIHVRTELGEAYLKCKGGTLGYSPLISELICAELAKLFMMPIPDFSIIQVTGDDKLFFHNGEEVEAGSAFISKRVERDFSSWNDDSFDMVRNKENLARMIVFDTWVKNFDRFPPQESIYHKNDDNLFVSKIGRSFDIIVYDHSDCLHEEGILNGKVNDLWVNEEGAFGIVSGMEEAIVANEKLLQKPCDDLKAISQTDIIAILLSVPKDWGFTNSDRHEWAEVIYKRAMFVAEYLPNLLFPQQQLNL